MSFDPKKITEYIRDQKLETPSYVFDLNAFKNRGEKVKAAFGDKVDICFSIKANPFLLVDLPEVFSKVEVCSPGELEICKELSIPPSKIIFSGVNKTRENVHEAFQYRVESITAESQIHLNHIISESKSSEGQGYKPAVLLRLSDESQFGIDEEELVSIVKNRHSFPEIEIKGIHYFTGTGKRKSKEIRRELDRLRNIIKRLKTEADFDTCLVEYGTGLGVEYFPKLNSELDYSPSLMDEMSQDWEMNLLDEASLHIREFAEELSNEVPDFKMTVEMGRFFATSCGYYIVRIDDIKTNDGINYIIVDGGLHQLKYDGQLQGMKIPAVSHLSPLIAQDNEGKESTIISSKEFQEWTICGSLCTTADVLVRNLPLRNAKVGDYLVFHRTGAYSVTEGMSLFLSRDIPGVYVFHDSSAEGSLSLLRPHTEIANINTPLTIR